VARVVVLTQIKFCGTCRPADAAMAALAGADYVGVILAHGYTRARSAERAQEVFAAAGGVQRVGVFVDPSESEVATLAGSLELDIAQLHGEETIAFAERLRDTGLKVWKAIRPRTAEEFVDAVASWSDAADGILVDGWSAVSAGGTGNKFDWSAIGAFRNRVPKHCTFIVAGGLRPGNVGEAMRLLHPDVVDVSSGVESSPCEKSPARMREFVDAVRAQAVLENTE
jgi:phosphoribosylanthranilate isomerase